MSEGAAFFVVVTVAFIFGCLAGCSFGTYSQRTLAAQAGVGHWTVNPTNGETAFVFKGAR